MIARVAPQGHFVLFFFLFLAFNLFFMLNPINAESSQEEPARVTADLDGVSLEDFISFVSRFTGKNMGAALLKLTKGK